MIVIMRADAHERDVVRVVEVLARQGSRPSVFHGDERVVIAGLGTRLESEFLASLELFPGVERVTPMMGGNRLTSRQFRPRPTLVSVGAVVVGPSAFTVIAGSAGGTRESLLRTARAVAAAGASLLRGATSELGPSPFGFLGLSAADLALLAEARAATGLPIVGEVLEPHEVEQIAATADMLQVGARNMQNYPLLREVARTDRPVLLTRGLSATIDEWLLAAEYVLHEGNDRVVLCERGIRGFEPDRAATLDVSAVPIVKRLSHLPVIVDAGHGAGHRYLVQPLALAAAAAGADGIVVDVELETDDSLTDTPHTLTLDGFATLQRDLSRLLAALNRPLARAGGGDAPAADAS